MSDIERFNESAATWDDDPEHVQRAHDVATIIRSTLPLNPEWDVLEIGGGTGLLARALVADVGTVLVTDVAPGMVEQAAKVLDSPRYVGWDTRLYDIEHDPLVPERFDLVLGQLALHHMGDVPAVMERCGQLLRPGGRVALVDLDHDPEGDFHDAVHDFHGHDGFTRENIRTWLVQAGFTEVEIVDAGTVTKEVGGAPQDFPMFLATGRIVR